MFDYFDGSIENSDHRLYLAKDRSKKSKPGKYLNRPKADRPQDKLATLKARHCKKKKITDIDIAKEIVSSARRSRSAAASDGRVSKRREDRWYICESCSHGKAKIYHVTTLSEKAYADKFEASLRGEYSLAS